MYIGVYLCLSGFIMLPGVIVLSQPPRQRLKYALLSFLLVVLALVAFEGLSALTGLTRFGEPRDYSYPQDYLTYGPLGWLIMLLLPLGILSPLLLALVFHRKRQAD
jgi:hypothetical protein